MYYDCYVTYFVVFSSMYNTGATFACTPLLIGPRTDLAVKQCLVMDPSLLESSSRSKVESSTSQSSTSLVSCGVGVKIGGLWKRSQGISRFTKPNYKHRVFILTDQSLSYYGGTVDVSH